MMTNEQPSSVHEARQKQAELLLRAGDVALQAEDARRTVEQARAHAGALVAELARLREQIVMLGGWIAGAEAGVTGDDGASMPASPPNGAEGA